MKIASGLVVTMLLVPLTALPGVAPAVPPARPAAMNAAPTAMNAAPAEGAVVGRSDWQWPLRPVTIVESYVAPAHRYGPGHRGVDLRPRDPAARPVLRAPADGVVAFSGTVAGRTVITIDHGGGLVSTLEPVADAVPAGTVVTAGDAVATMSSGGHAQPGTVHFGVRLDGEYINPMLLLGGVPRAVLLPCC